MSIPEAALPVPEIVSSLAAGAALTPVWRNSLGGVTFRTDDGRFIKWGPHDLEANMRDEAERMRWARRWTTVPEVLDQGEDAAHEWLVTAALPGRSAVDPRWVADPETAVRAVGRGLRELHDALPVAECPWSWDPASRIANAAARGIRVPDHLRTPPPVDVLVACHGDACVPNTLLDDDGRPLGHVDLAALGVADRWADIAVASMSTAWNFGPGWEDALIEAYGVEPDRARIDYYRRLWNET
ncbi:aminoglycoside 3'-phosphotransferase [Microbacterium hydrocarbonoxydans]|uniref:aminoglycoside 3'-phosphotransferase n=1 Tax=Microbacterium hydrocarbonoxydans TaxID=273678 RepID=UPI00203D5BCF|nr:aminoglycoside 3'-phosphotransferase [Microbacterium hydrocarbonoxydans]MCM3780806.1 aminoglycoside 3'-phosphotransferase [Microbacterium hydrocarbonoxydans]